MSKWLKGVNPFIYLILIMGLAFFLRLAQMSFPLRFDPGMYSYASWMISIGERPYRDFFLTKTPLMHFLNAVPMLFFGPSIYIFLLVETLIVCLSLFLIYHIVWYISRDYWLALCAALLYALYSSKYAFSMGGGATENYVVFFNLVALWIAVKTNLARPSLTALFFFGVAIGCAALARQTGLISVLAWSIFWILNPWIAARRGQAFIAYTCGYISVFIIFGLYLVGTDSLHDFLDINFVHNKAYGTGELTDRGWLQGNKNLLVNMIKTTSPLLPFVFVGLYQLDRYWILVIVMGLASLIEVFALGTTALIHYGSIALPSVCILTAKGMRAILTGVGSVLETRNPIPIFLVLMVLLYGGLNPLSHASFLRARLVNLLKGNELFMADNFVIYKVANELHTRLSDEQPFGYWGYHRQISMLARRRSLREHSFFHWFTMDLPSGQRVAKEAEFVLAIKRHWPKIVVVETNPLNLFYKIPKPPDSLMSLLSENYRLVGTHGPSSKSVGNFRTYNHISFHIWELREGEGQS